MNVDELKQACRDAIARGERHIVLVTASVRLCGRRGPVGVLVCVNAKHEKVVRFEAAKVLKFVEANEASQ